MSEGASSAGASLCQCRQRTVLRNRTKKTVRLPAVLLEQWIASTAPNVDLRGVEFSPAQWCTATATLLHTPPSAVTSLYLDANSNVRMFQLDQFGRGTFWGDRCAKQSCAAGKSNFAHAREEPHQAHSFPLQEHFGYRVYS